LRRRQRPHSVRWEAALAVARKMEGRRYSCERGEVRAVDWRREVAAAGGGRRRPVVGGGGGARE
jgi:hypothetical protein